MAFWHRNQQTDTPGYKPPPIDLSAVGQAEMEAQALDDDLDRPTLARHPEWIDNRKDWREKMRASGRATTDVQYMERMDRLRERLADLGVEPEPQPNEPLEATWLREHLHDQAPTSAGHYMLRVRDGMDWLHPQRTRLVHLSLTPNGTVVDGWSGRLARCIPADWAGPVELPKWSE